MATQKGTADFILQSLGQPRRFRVRAMFGEYALYADNQVVALICDDQLYVKILPASAALADCEQDSPFPGAKKHYVVDEGRLARLEELPQILLDVAKSLPVKKAKPAGTRSSRSGQSRP